MKTAFVIAFLSVTVGALAGSAVTAYGQVVGLNISPDKLRFRIIGDEPIAAADLRNIASGMKVLVLRDAKSDQCFTMFVAGSAMSVTGPSACP